MNHFQGQVVSGLPEAQGLYHPSQEHDACGIGFVANIKGEKSHDIIEKGIQILVNLTHRGACGCDPETGDGAGVLIQIPHDFFARETAKLGFTLPAPGEYGVGMCFLPVEPNERREAEGILESIIREEGLTVLIVEQNVQQVLDVVDRAYLLEVGAIKLSGTSAELKDNSFIRQSYMGL